MKDSDVEDIGTIRVVRISIDSENPSIKTLSHGFFDQPDNFDIDSRSILHWIPSLFSFYQS